MILFQLFGSRGSDAKRFSVLPADDILVHGVSETENFLKAWRTSSGGSSYDVVEEFAWSCNNSMQAGAAAQIKFSVNDF
jgi:hypothetical protein